MFSHIYVFVQALHMPRSKNNSGVYRPKYKKIAHLSLVSLSARTRSRPGTERIRQGEGRLSRPPKTALERSDWTENSSSENRILRLRRKKTPDRIPPKRMIMYIFIWSGPNDGITSASIRRVISPRVRDNLTLILECCIKSNI